ncbi:Hypothetical predicted protein [Cloeon dipterum]|uniref:Cerebellar degeneration-related protein 2-like n=1 Tax=Cloeon dipterum TaxID=197152 RepID=A0A8S1DZJ1_9INSE|nr:Hypothetical predicted protein [Cloeon dipterum]
MFANHRAEGLLDEDVDPADFRNCMMQDLQLAAELGKTLLERNKELEHTLRQQQTLIDDQTQEIEYLTKQTTALREVNNSRLRIYEQLEVSIQELERNNQRLHVENAADKKQIKSLCHSLDSMETRCEELSRQLEEAQAAERRRQAAAAAAASNGASVTATTPPSPSKGEEQEALVTEVAQLRAQQGREQKRAEELEEQLTLLIQENAALEEHVAAFKLREEQLRNFEEEITNMQGQQMCFRCMKQGGGGLSTATPSLMDDDFSSSIMEDESILDDDLDTEVQSIASETQNTVLSDNPYRVLVEKYEALLSMQRRPSKRSGTPSTLQGNQTCSSPAPSLHDAGNCLSLQEELQLSGEFGSPGALGLSEFSKVEEGEPKDASGVQTGFSEAETNSSSGVSEGEQPRQQHRASQTDLMSGGGKLLWSISAPASECVVSVYDECADPTESRFQKAPEYKELFSEIFSVLKTSVSKTAAESKEKSGAKEEKREKRQKSPESKVSGQAEAGEADAGTIEPLDRDEQPSPSSVQSVGRGRRSRRSKARARAERKAEQLRRKVLALTPEQLSQERQAAAAAAPGPSLPPREHSPAASEHSRRGAGGAAAAIETRRPSTPRP